MDTWAPTETAKRSRDVFVGREMELGRLNQAWKRAVDGATSLAIVQGEPETGKKALIRQFHRGLEIDYLHLVSRCHERECQLRFGIAEQLLGSPAESGTAADDWEATESSNGSAVSIAGRRILQLLGDLQQTKPVLLQISDIHWADPESISALCYALRRLRSARVLVLVSSLANADRHSELADLAREDNNCVVPIEGLSVDEVRQLSNELGIGPLSAISAGRLCAFTSGRPVHLLPLLRETPIGLLANSYERLPAPQSARRRVDAELEGLSPDARGLLEGVAVHGIEATLESAEHIGGVTDFDVALAGAESSGLVVVDLAVGRSSIRFRDPQLASAVYLQMGAVARAAAHERAAEICRDPEASLLHRISAVMRADSRLAAETEAVAEQKVSVGEIGKAADLMIAAGNLSDSEDLVERRLLRSAELLVAGCEHDRASDVIGSMVEPIDEIGYRYALGCVALGRGRLREAQEFLEGAQTAAASAGRTRLATKCAAHRMVLACRECRFDEAIPLLGTLGDQAPSAAGLETVPFAAWSWEPQPTTAADSPGEGMRRFSSGHDALIAGQHSVARQHLSRAVEEFNAHDADLFLAVSTGYLGWAELCLGEWNDAAEHFDEAIARLSWGVEPAPSLSLFLLFATRLHADRGEWLIAEERAGRIAEIADERPERLHGVLARAAEAHIARARGDDERVVELLAPTTRVITQPLAMWDVGGVIDNFYTWATASIRVGRVGDVHLGAPFLAAGGASNARGALLSLHTQACVAAAGPDDDKAERLFGEALALSQDANPFDVAHLEFSYGAHLRRRGHRRQAATMLESAVARFRSLGAQPDEGRCRQELKACGRPNGGSIFDKAILTPREASVAELVALGKSNQRVADALFVSRRTVEYHMSNVLRKLGLSSRMELAGALGITGQVHDDDASSA